MSDVLVRFEAPMLGHGWRDEVRVTRTPLVDNLLAAGKLTLLAEEDPTEEDPTGGATPDGVTGTSPDPVDTTPAEVGAVSWFGPETKPED